LIIAAKAAAVAVLVAAPLISQAGAAVMQDSCVVALHTRHRFSKGRQQELFWQRASNPFAFTLCNAFVLLCTRNQLGQALSDIVDHATL
jgi:hypothetical protein